MKPKRTTMLFLVIPSQKIELKKTNAQNNYDMSQILAELQKLNTNFA